MGRETVFHHLMKKKFTRYRKFNGKRYEIAWVDQSKRDAEVTANAHRMGGSLVRVIHTDNGYVIYTRSKPFYTKARLRRM